MKLMALVQIEVTLTDDEWEKIQKDYRYIWREEIDEGNVPNEIGPEDAWNHMVDDPPDDFEITWDHVTDIEYPDDQQDS
jgi:hypothetical protein